MADSVPLRVMPLDLRFRTLKFPFFRPITSKKPEPQTIRAMTEVLTAGRASVDAGMDATFAVHPVIVESANQQRGAEIFNRQALSLLGVTGEEFLERHNGGYAWPADQANAVEELEMLLPFVQ